MIRQTRKLEGLIPEPNESPEAYIARGQAFEGKDLLDFRPQEGDSLGEYLLRLRLANRLSPEDVETHLKEFPHNVGLNRSELAKLESGYLGLVNEQRLRVLATLFGVPHEWLLQTAQYRVDAEITPLPATDNAFAMMTMRSVRVDALDAEERQTLEQILGDIVSAIQEARLNAPPNQESS